MIENVFRRLKFSFFAISMDILVKRTSFSMEMIPVCIFLVRPSVVRLFLKSSRDYSMEFQVSPCRAACLQCESRKKVVHGLSFGTNSKSTSPIRWKRPTVVLTLAFIKFVEEQKISEFFCCFSKSIFVEFKIHSIENYLFSVLLSGITNSNFVATNDWSRFLSCFSQTH